MDNWPLSSSPEEVRVFRGSRAGRLVSLLTWTLLEVLRAVRVTGGRTRVVPRNFIRP